MTLEDFFTLTEMKDGLTSLARVEELVSVMQKEKDSAVKNVGEAARQWSTVASTLAATVSKDCLDVFIRLDGLCFLDRWIKEAQKCSNDISESSVEESITVMLEALEKLPIDQERSVSSGISVTVKNLFGHKNFRVQDRARALFDGWNQGGDNGADHQDVEKSGACQNDEVAANAKGSADSGCPEQSAVNVSPLRGSPDENNPLIEPSGGEIQHPQSSDGSHSQGVEDVNFHISNNQHASLNTLNPVNEEDGFRGDSLSSSIMLKPCQESQSSMEESSLHPAERTASTGTCSSSVPLKDNVEKSLDVSELNAFTDDVKETDVIKSSQDKSGREEISPLSASLGPKCVSSTTNPDTQQPVMEPAVPIDADAKDSEFILQRVPFNPDSNTNTLVSDPMSSVPKRSRSTGELKTEGLETSRMEDMGAVTEVKELPGASSLKANRSEESAIPTDISKLMMVAKDLEKIDKRRSDMELEYGVDDALEVARQVAKEVEQEVVDYREPFCSSSPEKNSEGGVVQPGSPYTIYGEPDKPTTRPVNEVRTGQNLPVSVSSSMGEGHLISSNNIDAEPEDCLQDPESSRVTEAAQETSGNTERGMCCFDLNQVCSDEMDFPTNPISSPIPVVSTSKAAAAAAPVVEGTLGWKRSAGTSAFGPASPRRTPDGLISPHRTLDGEKTPSIEGSSYSSKQRQDILNIDLNVAGVDDDGIMDLVLAEHIPVSSSLPSGESSVEVSSRRAERLKLDLNRVGDNEDAPVPHWKTEGRFLYHHQDSHQSSSTASSSSRQPSIRNIDLNDNPAFCDDTNDRQHDLGQSSSRDMTAYGGFQMDGPVISIMGKKVEVNRKEFVPQTRSFLPNGLVDESVMEANLGRSVGGVRQSPAISYTPLSPPVFEYNGLTVGPSMSVTPAIYGPGSIPYTADSRGVHVAPPIMGSSASELPSYSRSPFLMSITGRPLGLNGVAPTQPGLDLNSGVMIVEGDSSRETGGLRQLFVQGQGGSVEQTRSALQPLSSGIGIRRREPDGGWDSHPDGYKRRPPWN